MAWRGLSKILLWAIVASAWAATASAACRKVEDVETVKIAPAAMESLAQMGLDRAGVFAAIQETANPETGGCWAGPAGNFDSQILSVGALQWNYGQQSLQRNFRLFRQRYATAAEFQAAIDQLAPTHGALLFSPGCVATKITADCKSAILALQTNGKLDPVLAAELENLFNSDLMVQIQVDRYVTLLTSVRDDMKRVFGTRAATPKKLKWAIDTAVQQGNFPTDAAIKRMRERADKLDRPGRAQSLHSLVTWYDGLCGTLDQDGTKYDADYNVRVWNEFVDGGEWTDEQFDLLYLSHLRSRASTGDYGRWQALTFQRRATIVIGRGSVAGRRIGQPPKPRPA